MTDSRALIAEYARKGTESAFRDLVARYIDLVYSTALRQVGGNTHLAEDVAQAVFLCLAKKARTLPQNVMLGGWLHQTTRKVASTVMRGERRRQVREREAAQMNALQNEPSGDLEQVAPIIDDAIGQLPEEDQTAVLLRFFEKRDFRAVGEALGSSENAARMRVNRALEKLGVILKQRGITISVSALGAALAAEAVTAAPVGLAATVAGSALMSVAAASAATLGIFKIMAISKLQLGTISAIVSGGLTTALVVQHRSLGRMRDENQFLEQQIQDLGAAKDQLAKAQTDQGELERLRRDQSELLRLRGEVTALRKAAKLAAMQPAPASSTASEASAPSDATPNLTQLQASVRVQVGNGQTLLTGGWASEPGKRVFVLATPRIQGDKADQVGIRAKVVEVPEAALAKVGLDAFTVEGSESSVKQVFTADQVQALLKELEVVDGAKVLAESGILADDGQGGEIQTHAEPVAEGGKQPLVPTITVVPVISADKSAIDITLQAGINRPSPKPQ